MTSEGGAGVPGRGGPQGRAGVGVVLSMRRVARGVGRVGGEARCPVMRNVGHRGGRAEIPSNTNHILPATDEGLSHTFELYLEFNDI